MTARVFLSCYDKGISRAEREQDGSWKVQRLLPEFSVTCLASDPSDPDRVFAGTSGEGIWRSKDRGLTWEFISTLETQVKSLSVSPHDPLTIYAGTKPALVYKTVDGGRTWEEMEGFRRIPNRWWWFSPAEPPDFRPYVIALTVSPSEPEVVMAGVEFGGVFRSDDGGENWSRHRSGSLRDCHSLKFHNREGSYVYQAGGTGGGAAYSQDGGIRFKKAKSGLAKNYGVLCAADPEKPEIWYVSVAPGPGKAYGDNAEVYLYRAAGGAGWQPIGWENHPLPTSLTALTTFSGEPGHLYVGTSVGDVWHTRDYGDSWEKLPFNLGGIWFSLLVL